MIFSDGDGSSERHRGLNIVGFKRILPQMPSDSVEMGGGEGGVLGGDDDASKGPELVGIAVGSQLGSCRYAANDYPEMSNGN